MAGFSFIDGGFDDIFLIAFFFHIWCLDCTSYNRHKVYNLENRMVNIW